MKNNLLKDTRTKNFILKFCFSLKLKKKINLKFLLCLLSIQEGAIQILMTKIFAKNFSIFLFSHFLDR